MFNFEEELKNLPELPGVYIMRDKRGEVIYVGKAKVLKNRVRQYFGSRKNHTPKVIAMVSNVSSFEYIITDSETEALVLECNLIKKYRPRYNILLKDDKQYPYIKVTLNEEYPRIFMTRKQSFDGAKYFGPYTGMQTIQTALEIVQKIFKPPICTRKFPEDIGKARPCLNYHINNCFAPCVPGNVSKEEYRQIFLEICTFLDGNHKELLESMNNEMVEASKLLEFEKAAKIRDKIEAVHRFESKQKIINTESAADTDVIASARLGNKSFVSVFFIRNGKVTGRLNFKIDDTEYSEDGEVLAHFIEQFYSDDRSIPKEILTEFEPDGREVIEGWLSKAQGKKVTVHTPVRGEKRRLIEMVHKNAETAAENYRINNLKYAESKNKISEELAKKLKLEKIPVRIESYDISNISGSDNVASMVVFVNGKPSKSDYRKFKIKSFEGANDFLAMQEVIYRRFRHAAEEEENIEKGVLKAEEAKFLPYPDVILLDGGKGQISAVAEIMEAIDQDIPIFGMVKDGHHRTRGLLSMRGEVEVKRNENIFKLITAIQDEVHRVAVGYHRKLRTKGMVKSELDSIKGVGEVKKAALMKAFGSVERIKKADIEEIEGAVDKKTAAAVYEYFREEENVQSQRE